MHKPNKPRTGFTIVELLIVIVIIAILSAISIVAYTGIQTRARNAKISSDLAQITKAIQAARINSGMATISITGTGWTAGGCIGESSSSELATLNKTTHQCWTTYLASMQSISTASGMDVTGLVDPWGRPYFLDENEQEQTGTYGPCGIGRDAIGSYTSGAINWQAANVQYIPYATPGC